jgi:hypothetical protein
VTCAAELALHHLIALQSQFPEVLRTQAQLQAVTGGGDPAAAQAAIEAAGLALRAVSRSTVELQRLVAANDGQRDIASVPELALRAQQWVIAFQLHAAAQALHAERLQTGAARPLFTGPLQSIRDLIEYVCGVSVRANERWLVFRWPPRHAEPAAEAHARRARYRAELGAAARDIRALHADPHISYFLRHAPEREPLRAPCAAIGVALGLSIDLDPEAVAWLTPTPPPHTPGGWS